MTRRMTPTRKPAISIEIGNSLALIHCTMCGSARNGVSDLRPRDLRKQTIATSLQQSCDACFAGATSENRSYRMSQPWCPRQDSNLRSRLRRAVDLRKGSRRSPAEMLVPDLGGSQVGHVLGTVGAATGDMHVDKCSHAGSDRPAEVAVRRTGTALRATPDGRKRMQSGTDAVAARLIHP
jgi:hypothetical protein